MTTPPVKSTTMASAVDESAPPPAEPSLHEKILTEFVGRLRSHEHVGDKLASAISAIVQGPKMPKRELIVETLRNALDAEAEDQVDDPAP